MERTNAYRVGVKVDASVLENHLKRVTDDRRSTKKGNPLRNTSYLRRSALITTLVICRNIVSLSEELIKVFTSLISTWLESWLVVSFLSSQSITCKKGGPNKHLQYHHLIVRVVLAEVVDVLDVLVPDHPGPDPDEMDPGRKAPRSLRFLVDHRKIQLHRTSHQIIVQISQWGRWQFFQRKRWLRDFWRHMRRQKVDRDQQKKPSSTRNKSFHLSCSYVKFCSWPCLFV